jgi:bifunctional DNA-binding transcriptional regulator/antitoxin component of YhaV-PrlF toxin-antitoxin module
MVLSDESIIGKKGEILPKKPLRDISGLNPGDKVYIEALPGKLVVHKVYTVRELFNRPKIGTITPQDLDQELVRESDRQETKSVTKLNKRTR